MAESPKPDKSKDDHLIEYTVDDEPQTTTDKTMTPVQIMEKANITSGDHYLVQIVGKNQVSYKDKPNEILHMHPKMVFVSNSTVATTVS